MQGLTLSKRLNREAWSDDRVLLVDASVERDLHQRRRDPGRAVDRDVYLPHMEPGSYAIMNRDWRYIHYADDTE